MRKKRNFENSFIGLSHRFPCSSFILTGETAVKVWRRYLVAGGAEEEKGDGRREIVDSDGKQG